jgi:hypothetical protein
MREQLIHTSVIENHVMGRVYAWYFFRTWSVPFVLSMLGLGALLTLFMSVSWSHVFANMPNIVEIGALSDFLTAAILNTEFPVKLALALMLALAIVSIRKLVRTVVQPTLFGYAQIGR